MLYARINPLELRYTSFLNNGSIDAVPRYRSCWLCLVMAVPWLAVPYVLLMAVQWDLSIAGPWFLRYLLWGCMALIISFWMPSTASPADLLASSNAWILAISLKYKRCAASLYRNP